MDEAAKNDTKVKPEEPVEQVTQEDLMRQIVELQKQIVDKKPEKQKGNGGRIFYIVVMMLVGLTYLSIFFFGGLLGLTGSSVYNVGLGFLHNVAIAPIIAALAIWGAIFLILKNYSAKVLVNVTFGVAFLYELIANIDMYIQMTSSKYGYYSQDDAQALILSIGRFALGAVVIGVLALIFNKMKIVGEKMAVGNGEAA